MSDAPKIAKSETPSDGSAELVPAAHVPSLYDEEKKFRRARSAVRMMFVLCLVPMVLIGLVVWKWPSSFVELGVFLGLVLLEAYAISQFVGILGKLAAPAQLDLPVQARIEAELDRRFSEMRELSEGMFNGLEKKAKDTLAALEGGKKEQATRLISSVSSAADADGQKR